MATLLPRYQQCNSMSGNLNLLMLQQRCWESHGRRLTYSSQIDLNQAATAPVGSTWRQASRIIDFALHQRAGFATLSNRRKALACLLLCLG